ncbi:MAG: ribonuclease J [Alphaproteobacteria bacterium]|nr:ribonuclease J [Alphaproteobacteria bacterium]
MTLNFNKLKDQLLFVPLGGSGEIGMNLNLYHHQGKWLIVDIGAGFADEYFPGVDMLVPDITFLEGIQKDIVGAVFTHAHEDHIGAVQYVWDKIRCPIYATPFTAALLREKLKEVDFGKEVKINLVQPGSAFSVASFNLEYVQLTHSVPEMNAIFIRTAQGNILHTGDWKFDPRPVVGPSSDFDKLKRFADEGVLALVGDSTNVFKKEASGSEGDLEESISNLVNGAKGLVIVATFASNVARIETIAKAAQKAGRRLMVAGRSIHRIVKCAKETGYLRDVPEYLDESEFSKHKREDLLILCTGCQGEPRAALNRIVGNSHRNIKIKKGDSVIFSSKIIPGNDKRISWLMNQLARLGIEVMTERDHFVHVSGHPSRNELQHMYELVRPHVAIPVHGEVVHIHEHAKMALEWGVPHAVQVEDGCVVRLSHEKTEIIGQVQARQLALDGHTFLPGDSAVMRMRRKMKREGIIIAFLSITSRGELLGDVVLTAPGLLDKREDKDLILDIAEEVSVAVTNQYRGKKNLDKPFIENITKGVINRMIQEEIGKSPVIEVHIQEID